MTYVTRGCDDCRRAPGGVTGMLRVADGACVLAITGLRDMAQGGGGREVDGRPSCRQAITYLSG
jgi:hypothetical protein